jgi:ribonuclease P protein component
MIPKSKRLSRYDFSKLHKRNIIRGNFFDIAVSPSKTTKFAVVIAKKRIKLAVERNRVKRKIYHLLKTISLNKHYFIVIYPKHNICMAPLKSINDEMLSIFATL